VTGPRWLLPPGEMPPVTIRIAVDFFDCWLGKRALSSRSVLPRRLVVCVTPRRLEEVNTYSNPGPNTLLVKMVGHQHLTMRDELVRGWNPAAGASLQLPAMETKEAPLYGFLPHMPAMRTSRAPGATSSLPGQQRRRLGSRQRSASARLL
jgi:hypothetical protein